MVLLSLLGCPGTVPGDSRDSGGSGIVCGAWLADSDPASGEEDVWWTDPVVLTMSRRITEGVVSTNFGPGTTSIDGAVVTFVPDAPFPPASTVNVTLSGCGGTLGTSFATAASGLPVDTAAVPGHTWQLSRSSSGDLDAMRILDRLYDVTWPMLGVSGAPESPTLTFFAPSSAGESCDGWTGALDAAWVTDSFVAVESDTLVVLVDGASALRLRLDYFFVGFSVDGGQVEGTHLLGAVDARDVAAIASLGLSAAEVCDLWSSFGVTCDPCDDAEAFCGAVVVDDLSSADVDPAAIEDASRTCGA